MSPTVIAIPTTAPDAASVRASLENHCRADAYAGLRATLVEDRGFLFGVRYEIVGFTAEADVRAAKFLDGTKAVAKYRRGPFMEQSWLDALNGHLAFRGRGPVLPGLVVAYWRAGWAAEDVANRISDLSRPLEAIDA